MSLPQRGQIRWPAAEVFAVSSLFISSLHRHVFTPETQDRRHPDQLLEEFLQAPAIGRVLDRAVFPEERSDAGEVAVPEDRNEPELPHHRKQVLDDAGSPEAAGRDAADADGLVDVLLKVRVEGVLEQSRVAVVVLGRHDYESVGAHAELRERLVLDVLAGAGDRQRQVPDVHELRLDARELRQLRRHELRDVLAVAPLPGRAEDDGNREWPGLGNRLCAHLHLARSSSACPSGSRNRMLFRKPSSRRGVSTAPGEKNSTRPEKSLFAAPSASAVTTRVLRWRISLDFVSGAGFPSRGAKYSRNSTAGPAGGFSPVIRSLAPKTLFRRSCSIP